MTFAVFSLCPASGSVLLSVAGKIKADSDFEPNVKRRHYT